MEGLYVFFSASIAHDVFIDKQKQLYPYKQPLELQKLSDTKWVCQFAAVNAICCTYDSVLEEIAESSVVNKAIEARGLYSQIKSFSFLVSLITFDRLLTCTKQLSDKLQSSSLDLSLANEMVVSTKFVLSHEYRSKVYWKKVYDYATTIAKLHNIQIPSSERTRRK